MFLIVNAQHVPMNDLENVHLHKKVHVLNTLTTPSECPQISLHGSWRPFICGRHMSLLLLCSGSL